MRPEDRDLSGTADEFDAIEQKAAEWMVRNDRGLSPAQQHEFNHWLLADKRHAELYAELSDTWAIIGKARASAPTSLSIHEPVRRPPYWRNPILWLSVAASVTLALLLLQSRAPATPGFTLTSSTEVGALRKLPLPDGSIIQLNTDSAITVEFTASERHVTLERGEAHFQVAKNPQRPFIVNAGAVNVRAVGTAFDVRRRPLSIEVLVTEGKVRVNDSTEGSSRLPASEGHDFLVAGERAFIPVAAGNVEPKVVAVAPREIGQALAWQSQRLEFVATPLAEIVEEFNRYNRHKLVIADPRLAARRFGGTFPAGDYEEFVRLLESDFGIVAERDQAEIRLKLAP